MRSLLLLSLLLGSPITTFARALDDFADNNKTGWTDFTFVPGFGLPTESGGRFTFRQPPAGQATFSASQKTSEVFDLKEGRTLEFRVDMLEAGAKDSFPILAFIPTANSPGTLAGYGLAKSTTDILMTKGIGKYFHNENPAEPIKNENITLVLTLTARQGSVIVTGKVLDKAAGDAVLFEKTYVDTPAADVLRNGTDSPAAPYIASGYFTLYLYQDFDPNAPEEPYQAVFDNAEVVIVDSAVLDNFDDNNRQGWTNFTFVPGFGLAKEQNGQFRFEQPPAGQATFSAAQKTSEVFELRDGERLRFQVDVLAAGAKDSFPILAFIPTANSPGTLAGYGLAKSTTDVLLIKGIGKYFHNENPAEPIKNENITLSLTLTALKGSVIIQGQIFDKEANNAVIFDKTYIDTPAADVLRNGTDSPAAPFLGKGYFTLYLYQDFDPNAPEEPYRAHFDNAIVSSPAKAANVAPILSDGQPAPFANFLPSATALSFKVTDDKALADTDLSITLNGTSYTTANGLVVSAEGSGKKATLAGKLAANGNYSATFTAKDSEGESSTQTIYFDTFAESNLQVEVEDYNFDGGKFINAPVPTAEGSAIKNTAYTDQSGVPDVDFFDTRDAANGRDTMYRSSDPIRMQRSRDFARTRHTAAGGTAANIYDYDVGDIIADEWMNYTRNFPAGSYEVYLRESLANMPTGESVLEQVTSDPTKPKQSTKVLGSFLGAQTGFQHRCFPLTDGTGLNKIVVPLSGVTTLRLRQVTATPGDATRAMNYLLFVKVDGSGPQLAAIANISPTPDSTVDSTSPQLRIELQNRDTTVDLATVILRFNGQVVTPTVNATATGAVISYTPPSRPESGSSATAEFSAKDIQGNELKAAWKFVVSYRSFNAAFRQVGTGSGSGFKIRVVQAPAGAALANSLQRAEDQLRPNSPIAAAVDVTATARVINFTKNEGQDAGNFGDDIIPPGVGKDDNGTDDFVLEALGYLELKKGIVKFGFITDDGYKLSAGATPGDLAGTPLAFKNGGPANESYEIVVPEDGLYPVRFLWYERGGSAYAEWFSFNSAGNPLLINDPAEGSIKAWQTVVPAGGAFSVESSLDLKTWTTVANPAIDPAKGTLSLPIADRARFYRLKGSNPPLLFEAKASAGSLLLHYGFRQGF